MPLLFLSGIPISDHGAGSTNLRIARSRPVPLPMCCKSIWSTWAAQGRMQALTWLHFRCPGNRRHPCSGWRSSRVCTVSCWCWPPSGVLLAQTVKTALEVMHLEESMNICSKLGDSMMIETVNDAVRMELAHLRRLKTDPGLHDRGMRRASETSRHARTADFGLRNTLLAQKGRGQTLHPGCKNRIKPYSKT